VSFWIDAVGEPHATNTVSLLSVTCPDGTTAPLNLNGQHAADTLTLYTPAVGTSTHSRRAREYILEHAGTGPWLPLQAGKAYQARVQAISDEGNSPLTAETMVLFVGVRARPLAKIGVGSELRISSSTLPGLRGVKTAISGGPILVRDGKPQRIRASSSDSYEVGSMFERHPRSAIGWNDDYFFLVEVDGRQEGWSVGMTLNELAEYLAELGCREAMNLDGGGSATLWHEGKIRNRPCDGRERPLANALVVIQKPPKSSAGQPPPPATTPTRSATQ